MNNPNTIPQLFNDSSESPILNYSRFNLDDVKRAIASDGYCIVKGLVPLERIQRIRSFWSDKFSKIDSAPRVTWTPYFGQANTIGFSTDAFQHLYRACDFLWNESLHQETRDVCLRIHALKNLILGENPFFGMQLADRGQGMFVTASYYPGGKGHMAMHNDGVADYNRLVHGLIPITFKGKDYADGGMVVIDRKGVEHRMEDHLEPGDAVFYDGALQHGVMPIVPLPGKEGGRIQIFPIPVLLKDVTKNDYILGRIPSGRFIKAKYLRFKDQVRIVLGLKPHLR